MLREIGQLAQVHTGRKEVRSGLKPIPLGYKAGVLLFPIRHNEQIYLVTVMGTRVRNCGLKGEGGSCKQRNKQLQKLRLA